MSPSTTSVDSLLSLYLSFQQSGQSDLGLVIHPYICHVSLSAMIPQVVNDNESDPSHSSDDIVVIYDGSASRKDAFLYIYQRLCDAISWKPPTRESNYSERSSKLLLSLSPYVGLTRSMHDVQCKSITILSD